MKYEINKPLAEIEDGWFSILLKNIILFIVGFLGLWILLVIISLRKGGSFISGNEEFISIIFALTVIILLGNRIYKKYKFGTLISIELDISCLKLGIINTFNGSRRTEFIDINHLKIEVLNNESRLFGSQRIFKIYNRTEIITILNINTTAWCRHPDIEKIISELNSSSSNLKK